MAKSAKTSATTKEKEEPKVNLKAAVTQAVGGKFDKAKSDALQRFKKSHNLSDTANFKPQSWLPMSPAFRKATGLPGLYEGGLNIVRGWSDSGKTTVLIEAAISAQKAGKLPVFIITEQKFKFQHIIDAGFEAEEVVDEETGEITYQGDFIYIDREHIDVLEDVAKFILDLFDEQKKNLLMFDLVILWDSAGSLPSRRSVESKSNNAQWNAGCMSEVFGQHVVQEFAKSRKKSYPYINTFVVCNQVRLELPANPMAGPAIMRNKGGDALYWAADLVITMGKLTNAGLAKVEATKNGKKVLFGKITTIAISKNHISDVTTSDKIVMTAHGFIENTKEAITAYQKANSKRWLTEFGTEDVDVVISEEQGDSQPNLEEED